MIDLGDLREGIFFKNEDEIFNTVEEILKLKNIELFGLGVNLTCYGAVIPKKDNLSVLVEIARKIEKKFDIKLQMISGGNSSSIYLIGKNELPEGINNLRVGEAFLLGGETAYSQKLKGFYDDAFTLEAEIIELKEKQSVPIGETGVDAFGNKPVYEDRGIIKRAIIAVGRQDVDPDALSPIDEKIDILGASSDHLILDMSKSDRVYQVGDTVAFKLSYSSLLRATTSGYVDRVYV
jgi:predicted amino acid racemase